MTCLEKKQFLKKICKELFYENQEKKVSEKTRANYLHSGTWRIEMPVCVEIVCQFCFDFCVAIESLIFVFFLCLDNFN